MTYLKYIFMAFFLLFYLGCEDLNTFCIEDINDSNATDVNCTDINCTSYCDSINWDDLNASNTECIGACNCKPEPIFNDCNQSNYNYCKIITDDQNNSNYFCSDDLDFTMTCNFSSCSCNNIDNNGSLGIQCDCLAIPLNPNYPTNPSNPTSPINPSNPINPDNPTSPANPINPGNPTNPNNPINPGNPDNNTTNPGDGDSEDDSDQNKRYILHNDINATLFFIGGKDAGGNDIVKSDWDSDWKVHYGGIDTPDDRKAPPHEYWPNWPGGPDKPGENSFYIALPYNDLDAYGNIKASRNENVPWATENDPDKSICKNRWVEIEDTATGRKAYAQWEDVGPYGNDNEVDYVFHNQNRPNGGKSGISISPAVRDWLQDTIGSDINYTNVNWRFVEETDVKNGPWKAIKTTRSSD
jgi:hypothetical protein